MIKGPFLDRNWMGQNEDYNSSDIIMLGLPFDGTASYRSGARFAPELLRISSWAIEEFSPIFSKTLKEANFNDAGDLELPVGNTKKSLDIIQENIEQIYADKKKFLGVGGEHLVTYPAIKAINKFFNEITVLHFDAHADLRKNYIEEKLSHASTMCRIGEIIGFESIKQVGIRSGTQDEFEIMKKYETKLNNPKELCQLKNKNIFVSIDLDVLDPSIMPGTGTPEPGGFSYTELEDWIKGLKDLNIIGADVVELSPHYDASGVSTITAAKIIRELLMCL